PASLGAAYSPDRGSLASTDYNVRAYTGAVGTSLFHTIRFTQTEAWQPWGDVEDVAGHFNDIEVVGCAESEGELHVVVAASRREADHTITNFEQLHHAIRHTSTASWQRFHNVEQTAAGTQSYFFRGICAAHFIGNLNVLVCGEFFAGGRASHTIRFARELVWQ